MSLGLISSLKITSLIKFGGICVSELKIATSSTEKIWAFHLKEPDAIVDYLPLEMMIAKPKKSWKMSESPWSLIWSAGTLKQPSFQAVYPKSVLSATWAQVVWPKELELWKHQGLVADGISIDPLGTVHKYSQIQKYQGKLLPICVDPSHLLTNMRVKVTKDRITGIPCGEFFRVCDKNPEILNKALARDWQDKQNVAFARRVFSAAVSQKMLVNGDVSAAELVTLMHEWYGAVDSPGLPAVEPVLCLHNMSTCKISLGNGLQLFPSIGFQCERNPIHLVRQYAQGHWQQDPDECHSHPVLGSLPVESFFRDFSDMEQPKLGCPKAIHIPRLMTSTTEINSYRDDPVNSKY